jgi:hypothetical protein
VPDATNPKADHGKGERSTTDAGSRSTSGGTVGSTEKTEQRPICTVAFCPICMAVTAAQGAAPDALEHLLSAAREFFLAARAVIDVRGDHLAGEDPNPNGSRDFEKIEIS